MKNERLSPRQIAEREKESNETHLKGRRFSEYLYAKHILKMRRYE